MLDGEFSDQDLNSAKQLIIASYKSVSESQDGEVSYYFAQELSDKFVSIDESIEEVNNVTKAQIVDIAKKVQLNTIYFLTGNE